MRSAPPETLRRIEPKTGPSSALNVKLRKLITPVAVPPNCGGLASLMTVYGIIAAPDAKPATRPIVYGGEKPPFPERGHPGRGRRGTPPPAGAGGPPPRPAGHTP